MPLLYWALLDIQQTITPTGYIIVTKTDVACHMWLRWTLKLPQKHPKAVITRGLTKMTDVRFCFVAFCDVEQEEEGDTFTHTFIMPSEEPPTDPPTSEWPFYEPWGVALTENYGWWKFLEPNVPNITLESSIITIENPGYVDCGILYDLPFESIPIAYSADKPLKIAFNNTEAFVDSTSTQLLHELVFHKGDEGLTVYLCVECGTDHDVKKPWSTGEIDGRPYVWIYFGIGGFTVDVFYWWKKLRQSLGLDSNPEGWFLTTIAFALGTWDDEAVDHWKNDYVGLYLPQTSHCNMQPWPNCQTRYFYFWATNAGERMISTSPIFSKHYLMELEEHTDYFYPDPHPEVTSVDGQVWHSILWPYATWEQIHDGIGTNAEPSVDILGVRIGSEWDSNTWRMIYRVILLFDTSTIPAGATIIAAKLRLYLYSYTIVADWPDFAVGVVASYPDSDTDVAPADYGHLGTILRSDTFKHSDIVSGQPAILTLNALGLAQITPGGITKLGLREMAYDAANEAPPWIRLKESTMHFFSADEATEAWHPRLEVTYLA